jgi:hypothetical protein
MKTAANSYIRLPFIIKLAIASVVFTLITVTTVGISKVSAEADPYPPCGPGWNCVVPEGWVYPATGEPIRNLCPFRKVLVPNASAFPGGTTTNSSSIYMEIWYSVYICSDHTGGAPEETSAVAWIISVNGVDRYYNSHNNARDGNVGGNGGAWTGIGWTVGFLNPGNNQVCHRVQGSISEAPGSFSNLGYCVNVFYEQISSSCSIVSAPASVNPGQTFNATLSATNTGNNAWTVDPSNGNRYKLGSSNPRDNTRWGTSRVELPGESAGIYGMVVYAGRTSTTTVSFTAPTTPGTYAFAWEVLREGYYWVGPQCSRNINVVDTAALDGVKIDDSGVSASGSTTPPWGGNCYSNTAPANCNNGTLANYPFSDNQVCVSGASCSTSNHFDITNIPTGTQTVSITTAGTGDNTWSLRGFKICASGGGCTTQWLTTTPLGGAAASFSHTFAGGTRYSMRWIYQNNPVTITCGTLQTLGPAGNPEPGETFTLRPSFTVTGGTFSDASRDIQITSTGGLTVPAPLTRDYVPASITAVASGYADFPNAFHNTPGVYTVTWQLVGTTATNCTGTVTVAAKPYIRIYNGDVLSGSGFANTSPTCQLSSGARQIGFNRGGSGAGAGAGAGTTLAAFALGKNVDFASAAMRAAHPLPVKGLTFANVSAVTADGQANGNYGGELSSGFFNTQCVPDYFTESQVNGGTSLAAGSSIPATVLPAGTTSASRVNYYVDGDVFITGNITYLVAAGANPTFGADPNTIPSFRVVARGNIYIAPGVSEINGSLIAQPRNDGTRGRIYTCAQSSWSANTPNNIPTAAQQSASCTGKLTIFGSVIAKELKLLRTLGTLRNAASNEPYTSANQAEAIIFSPEQWLRNPRTGTTTRQEPYQSITGLPPIL